MQQGTQTKDRFSPAAAAFTLGLTTIAFYAWSLSFWFVSDDFMLLRSIKAGGPFGVWSGRGSDFFRPLASLSLWMDFKIFGLNAVGFHFTNVLLHGICAGLVALLASRLATELKVERATAVGYAAGLLFAILPCHVEAVGWISCRSDLLAAALALASLHALMTDGRSWLFLGCVAFALAMASKESALMVPVMFALIGGLTGRKDWAKRAGALFLVAILMVAVRAEVLGKVVGGYGGQSMGNPAAWLGNLGPYTMKTIEPASLQVMAVSPQTHDFTLWYFSNPMIGAIAIAIVVIGGLIAFLRKGINLDAPAARLGAGLFLGFFVLALPALPLGMNPYTWEGSRFVYLPSVALCIFLGLCLTRLRPIASISLTFALAVGFVFGLYTSLLAWGQASDDARASIKALKALTQKTVLATVPDSYQGAYVLRNGLPDAVAVLGVADPNNILQVSSFPYEQRDSWPSLKPESFGASVAIEGRTLPLQASPVTAQQLKGFGLSSVEVRRFQEGLATTNKSVDIAVLTPEELHRLR